MEQVKTPLLRVVNQSTSFKLIIPGEVQNKIREWCCQLPTQEWSGILFYTAEGDFSDNSLVLTCKDFYVSDIGSGTFTEFEYTPEIINYMDENDLLDCYQGLIHSHNQIAAFFSTTDESTLAKEGAVTPHFLSLIVNNAGKYTARITKRVSTVISKKSYPTFGGNVVTEECNIVSTEYLESYPLTIEKASNSLEEEISERIRIIREEKLKQVEIPSVSIPTLFDSSSSNTTPKVYYPEEGIPTEPKGVSTNKVKEAVEDDSWINIKVPVDLLHRTLIQIITGSITSGYSDKFDLDKWCSQSMEKAFTRRFSKEADLRDWLRTYIESIVWFTYWKEVEDLDSDSVTKALSSALLEECLDLPENKVLSIIEEILDDIVQNSL